MQLMIVLAALIPIAKPQRNLRTSEVSACITLPNAAHVPLHLDQTMKQRFQPNSARTHSVIVIVRQISWSGAQIRIVISRFCLDIGYPFIGPSAALMPSLTSNISKIATPTTGTQRSIVKQPYIVPISRQLWIVHRCSVAISVIYMYIRVKV
jgi:hypothetical protein